MVQMLCCVWQCNDAWYASSSFQHPEKGRFYVCFKMEVEGRVLMDAEKVEWNVKSACNFDGQVDINLVNAEKKSESNATKTRLEELLRLGYILSSWGTMFLMIRSQPFTCHPHGHFQFWTTTNFPIHSYFFKISN